jgi:hypothetical protein
VRSSRAAGAGNSTGPSGATKPGENLVDADFEVVNDDKKKS